MDWFKELKIAYKLYLLVAIASFFMLLTSVVGYTFNAKAAKSLEVMYNENLVAISDLGDILGNLNRAVADVLNLFQYTTDAENNALTTDINNLKSQGSDLMKDFKKTNPSKEQLAKLDDFKSVRNDFWNKMDAAIALAQKNKNLEAYAIYKSNLQNMTAYRQTLTDLVTMQKEDSKKLFVDNEKATKTANILLAIISFASLALMVSLGFIISNAITKPIQHAIGELTTGSSEVSAASAQVESASQALAEGTTEQAASIQETSSTLEETSSMVQQNNDNTKQAAVLAKNAKDYAQKSNQEMHTMMTSMEDLKQSSNEIAKIIKVIDEIAFQTNILSLNAAVEAARAGDAGKGFAVVAEEVRNLAQRSAQAAKDTAGIIEKNISLSDSSAIVAKNVNESLVQIDSESRKVSELLEEISTATEEQSRGVNEINKAIQQMESVMQSNASTADESAAASRELASQAANVNEIVRSLIMLVEGAKAANTSSQLLINKSKAAKTVKSKPISSAPKPTAVKSKTSVSVQKSDPEGIIPLNDF